MRRGSSLYTKSKDIASTQRLSTCSDERQDALTVNQRAKTQVVQYTQMMTASKLFSDYFF